VALLLLLPAAGNIKFNILYMFNDTTLIPNLIKIRLAILDLKRAGEQTLMSFQTHVTFILLMSAH
jgi:hypothetical protein